MELQNKKIYTKSTPSGDKVSFCALRGGIITSLKLNNNEVLYLDNSTLYNDKAKVRGGIPILFPNAGMVDSSIFPQLAQHGFARDSSSWKIEETANGFIETLQSDENTMHIYPYDFKLSVIGELDSGVFRVIQKVENTSKEQDMPISMGLHPYFKVPNSEKGNVKFNFEGGKYIEDNINLWANGEYVCIDNPKIKDRVSVMEIIIPELGTLSIDASIEYKKIWVWSLPGNDFICIEPVMRDKGGLVSDPEIVAPGSTFMASVSIKLS